MLAPIKIKRLWYVFWTPQTKTTYYFPWYINILYIIFPWLICTHPQPREQCGIFFHGHSQPMGGGACVRCDVCCVVRWDRSYGGERGGGQRYRIMRLCLFVEKTCAWVIDESLGVWYVMGGGGARFFMCGERRASVSAAYLQTSRAWIS